MRDMIIRTRITRIKRIYTDLLGSRSVKDLWICYTESSEITDCPLPTAHCIPFFPALHQSRLQGDLNRFQGLGHRAIGFGTVGNLMEFLFCDTRYGS